jgi:hypothetical protein
MPISYECDQDGENCQWVWIDDDTSGGSLGYEPGDTTNNDSTGGGGSDTGGGTNLVDNETDTTSNEGLKTPIEILNTATKPGDPGWGWKYYSDGTSIGPDGKYYHKGQQIYDPANPTGGIWGNLEKILGSNLTKGVKSLFVNTDGSINLAGVGTLGAGLYSLLDSQNKDDSGGGYSTPVQVKSAYREAIEQPSRPTGAPAMGRRYFTDVQYLPKGDTAALDAAKAAAAAQKADLTMEPNASIRSIEPSIIPTKWNKPVETKTEQAAATSGLPAIPNALEIAQQTYPKETTTLASGGIAQMKNPRYLRGTTDGMADKIPSSIDNKQPAALSHGEFVIPADVVAHLGNGNSEAGAKKLYEMMSRVRKARTGTTKQGKQINPNKFMPGGLAALAAGGEVMRFNNGGGVTGGGAGGVTLDTSKTSSLSPWVGDYVTTALGEAAGLAAMPFQAYKGPLAAGASDLQTKAFAGAEGIASAGFDPTKYTTQSFTADQANKYMNPYLSAALDPQMKELRRQAQITNLGSLAKAGRAGIMSGDSRNLMEAENMRNLLSKQSDVLGTGYATAYDKAMDQFNKEQGRAFEAEKASEDSRKYSADFGFKSLAELARLGQTQRDIEADQIAADKAAFEEERGYAYKMPQYKLSLLGGLPTGTTTNTTDTSGLPGLMQNLSGLASIYEMLGKLGVK